MGIIRKQTVSGSFFSYAGVVLGFINLAILSPLIFTTEQIGLPSLIIAISVLASQFGSVGFNSVTIRLFPFFRDSSNNHNGFLGMSVLVQMTGLILVLCIMYFFIPNLVERNADDITILGEYAFLIIPLIIFHQFFVLFDTYTRVLYNAAIGIILKEFGLRILNLVLILLFYFDIITFRTFMYLYVLSYGIPAVILIIWLVINGEFSLRIRPAFITRKMRNEIISVSAFGVIAGLSGMAVLNVDKYMINEYLNLSSVGIYSIAFAFGSLILIPGRAMSRIAAPVIADLWKGNNIDSIKDVYKKSSVNQFIGGIIILLLVWINIDDVMSLLPDKYSSGKLVILFIALANLTTALSGISPQILNTSKSYRYHSYFMIALIVFIIITNIIFIPILGITGAALASLISTFIYMVIRVGFLSLKYGMHPFGFGHITSIISGLVVFLGVSAIHLSISPIWNIFIRLSLAGAIYILLIYFLKSSVDINHEIEQLFRKFFGRDRMKPRT